VPPWPFRKTLPPGAGSSGEAEIREEIELYLELRTEELMREGVPPEEARRLAEERFGDVARIESDLRRGGRVGGWERGRRIMSALGRDLAYALRTFRRSPGFVVVAVLTLGVAVGGNTAIFSVVDAALVQALPFPRHDGLVVLEGYQSVNGEKAVRWASAPEFRDWRDRSRTVSPMAAVAQPTLTLTGDGEAERVSGEVVSADYFRILGVDAAVGRTFTAEEQATPDAHAVAVLSWDLWQRRYAGDRNVLGRTIQIDERPFTMVGVLPEGFQGVSMSADVFLPISMISVPYGNGILQSRGSRFLTVIGSLANGATPAAAQAELNGIARDLAAEHPETHNDRGCLIQTGRDFFLGATLGSSLGTSASTTARLLWVLLGAGGLLLLIAAANVANLLLVRAHARTREIVVRRALGAGAGRVARQLLTESLVLALLGGVVGMALGAWGLSLLVRFTPDGVLPAYATPSLNPQVFAYSLIVLAGAGVLAGLAPAVAGARVQIATGLREGGRGETSGGGIHRLRGGHVFVVLQVALALALLVGAGLLVRSARAQLAVDPGFDLDGLVAFRVSLPRTRYPSQGEITNFTQELLSRVRETPGVQAASVSSNLPFRGGNTGVFVHTDREPATPVRVWAHQVSPATMQTLGARLRSGRFFTSGDDSGAPGVTVISEAMARRVFPGENPIGRKIYLGRDTTTENGAEVVGVLDDVRYRNLTEDLMAAANSPDVYYSILQIPARTLEVAVRVSGDPSAAIPSLRGVVAALDPALPVYQANPVKDDWRAQTARPRFAAFLMAVFSALAAVLACVGIYGVLAFSVGRRSREIAVRRAVGASASDVAREVVVGGLRLAAVGLAVGVLLSLAGGRVLRGLLFGVAPTDPWTLASVVGVMAAVALAAAAVPAWRAMRRDPAEVLNSE